MRRWPNDRAPRSQHHGCMETLRLAVRTQDRKTWLQVAWPALALGVAGMLDQSTRGPSLATLILSALF